jgi:hemerythrin
MIELSWRPEWDTFIEDIDTQHRELFGHVERLFNAVHIHANTDIPGLLKFLNDYTKEHFLLEEEMMKRAKFPDLTKHVLLHQGMKAKLALIHTENLEEKTIEWLIEWLVEHIDQEDKAFALYLHNQKF